MFLVFYLISFAIINYDYLVCALAQPKHEAHVRNKIDESLQLSHQLESRVDTISPAQFGKYLTRKRSLTLTSSRRSGQLDSDDIWGRN